MSTPPAVTAVTDATTGMSSDLLSVAGIGLGIGATVLVVKKGWRLLTGFIR